jgi:hypothetical protein
MSHPWKVIIDWVVLMIVSCYLVVCFIFSKTEYRFHKSFTSLLDISDSFTEIGGAAIGEISIQRDPDYPLSFILMQYLKHGAIALAFYLIFGVFQKIIQL